MMGDYLVSRSNRCSKLVYGLAVAALDITQKRISVTGMTGVFVSGEGRVNEEIQLGES